MANFRSGDLVYLRDQGFNTTMTVSFTDEENLTATGRFWIGDELIFETHPLDDLAHVPDYRLGQMENIHKKYKSNLYSDEPAQSEINLI